FGSYWSDITEGMPMLVRTKSGGGGIEGLNYVYAADPDGLTIGITTHSSDITGPPLLGVEGPDFDGRELGWIGSFGQAPYFIQLPIDSPYDTVADLQAADKIVWGSTNPGSTVGISSTIAIEVLELDNVSLVFGYETVEIGLAAARGEIDAATGSGPTVGLEVDKGLMKFFCVLAPERSPWSEETPTIYELTTVTPEQEELISFLMALTTGKAFFTPPGMDPEKLEYIRGVFDKMMDYKGFLKVISRRFTTWETPLSGAQTEKLTNDTLGMPVEKTEAIRALFEKYSR
ncbi:tripartite tricarboxylate transporter substrate-binding protein, partial [Chloroflexota bacterium]